MRLVVFSVDLFVIFFVWNFMTRLGGMWAETEFRLAIMVYHSLLY